MPRDCVEDQMEMLRISCCKADAKPISFIILRNGNALPEAYTRQLLQAFGLVRPSIGTKSQKSFRAPRVYRRQINAGAPGDLKSARWGRWGAPIGRERPRVLMGLIFEPMRR